MASNKNQRIQVFVRCRPLSTTELKNGLSSVVDVVEAKREITVRERLGDKEFSKKFVFDTVFGPTATQVNVYNRVARPCIEEVLQGYNCTIFAYGQTSTGKTHTMQGFRSNETCSWEKDPEAGIIPRTLDYLFNELEQNHADYTVRVSFLELYNEELNDLSSPGYGTKLKLFEDISRKGSVVIQGLSELTVQSKEEAYKIVETGANRRKTASTAMNDESSRSHTIFSITVHIKECTVDGEDLLKIGKLNLVDLAGSECIGRSGAVARRAREAGNINQSLLTLGRVITALVEKAPHVPYRESKLTRLLQDSLGGRTKTSIIATVSPAICDLEETLSTLDYAYRAKDITNKPEVNQKMTKKMLIREYTEEIERLRRDLMATAEKKGVLMSNENYNMLQFHLSSQDEEIKEKQLHIDALTEELERINLSFGSTKAELDAKDAELKENREKLEETHSALDETRNLLKKTVLEREEQKYVVSCRVKTEEVLTDQSLKLMQVADECTNDVGKLHDKLGRTSQVESANSQMVEEFRSRFRQKLSQLRNHLDASLADQRQCLGSLVASFNAQVESYVSRTETLKQMMTRLAVVHSQQLTAQSKALTIREKKLKNWVNQTVAMSSEKQESAVAGEKTFLTQELLPLLLSAKVLIEERNLAAQQFARKLEGKLAALNVKLGKHTDAIVSSMKKLEGNLQPLFDSNKEDISSCSLALDSFRTSQEDVDATLAEMQKEIERFHSTMTSLEQKLQEKKTPVEANLEKIGQRLDHFQATTATLPLVVDRHVTSVRRDVGSFTDSAKSDCREMLTLANDELGQGAEISAEAKARFERIDSTVSSHSSDVVQEYEKFHSSASSDVMSFKDGCLKDWEEKKKDLDGLVATVKTTTNAYEEETTEYDLRNAEYLQQQQNFVGGILTRTTELKNATESSVQAQDRVVDTFLHCEVKKDIPTGDTPQRRDYTYSQQLAATSPHERIVQRFRSTATEEEKEGKRKRGKGKASAVSSSTGNGHKPLGAYNMEPFS